jgi:hypothetical protein
MAKKDVGSWTSDVISHNPSIVQRSRGHGTEIPFTPRNLHRQSGARFGRSSGRPLAARRGSARLRANHRGHHG